MHTQTQTPTESYTFSSTPITSTFYFCLTPPSLSLPLLLFFTLRVCKAFPWLAVINLLFLGAGSWLRARKCSYKAKIETQKNRAAFLVSTHSRCCSSPRGNTAAHNKGRALCGASNITPDIHAHMCLLWDKKCAAQQIKKTKKKFFLIH